LIRYLRGERQRVEPGCWGRPTAKGSSYCATRRSPSPRISAGLAFERCALAAHRARSRPGCGGAPTGPRLVAAPGREFIQSAAAAHEPGKAPVAVLGEFAWRTALAKRVALLRLMSLHLIASPLHRGSSQAVTSLLRRRSSRRTRVGRAYRVPPSLTDWPGRNGTRTSQRPESGDDSRRGVLPCGTKVPTNVDLLPYP
jgi:hypothetical protein